MAKSETVVSDGPLVATGEWPLLDQCASASLTAALGK
jgi:hypothetical protein